MAFIGTRPEEACEPPNKGMKLARPAQAMEPRSLSPVFGGHRWAFEALPARTQDGRTAGGGRSWRRPQ